jgi:two-component system, OmpR family, sensor histidine kinase KdpD
LAFSSFSLAKRRCWQNVRHVEWRLTRKITKLKGSGVAEVVAGFVREKYVTQVMFGRSATGGGEIPAPHTAINEFLPYAPPVNEYIVTEEPS